MQVWLEIHDPLPLERVVQPPPVKLVLIPAHPLYPFSYYYSYHSGNEKDKG